MTDVFAPQSNSDTSKFIKRFQADGTAIFEAVGFEDIDFTAVFGKTTLSTSQNTISYGIKTFTLDVDNGSIQVGYPLQCKSLDDQDCFMQGVVTRKDTTSLPAEIDVAITIISALTNTSYNWELSVIPLAGFSINPSATVGISTTSINASGAGPFTFSTQTGKLFMQNSAIGGTVVCTSLSDPKTYLYGRIAAISGASLVLNKIYSNATGAVSSWSIQLFDGPAAAPPYFSISGLSVTNPSALLVTIQPGSVVDSTGTITLTTTVPFTKDLGAVFSEGGGGGLALRAQLAGTITNSGTAITGVGTNFLTDFGTLAMTDYTNSLGTITINRSVISTAAGSSVTAITDNTNLTTFSAVTASASTYYRGGVVSFASSLTITFYICMMRRDSDGVIDFGAAVLTPTGAPDLPAGYTYYRIIAAFERENGAIHIDQPIAEVAYPFASDQARYIVTSSINSSNLPNSHVATNSTSVVLNNLGGLSKWERAALTGDVTASQNSNATTLSSTSITNKTEKTSLADDDLFLIADSAASFALKKAKKSNVGSVTTFPQDFGLITEAATLIFDSGTVP